ncbi:hypothetical protein RhiirA1_532278 [Rhizophagus irregularis]|uniref:Uncharacterized protein n=1 Tax=Rhizophagus irregularis TaxID=588596 RepID=A0A2N0S627_9GLOM|nr:hypothetical protein RhiirA1_532278 [Rhizophagus irregularis]
MGNSETSRREEVGTARPVAEAVLLYFLCGIGYWNLEMKGFDWVPGDWGRQIVFWSSWDYFVLRKSFIFLDFFKLSLVKHVY